MVGILWCLRPEPTPVRLAGIAGPPGAKLAKFRPLHDRVVIRRIEGEEKTKGGILIPDTAKEKPQEGEVIAVRGQEPAMKVASWFRSTQRRATGSYSANGPARRSRSTAKTSLIAKESDVMGVIVKGTGEARKRAA